MGGKVLAAGYPFGEYDALVVFKAPDDTAAAASRWQLPPEPRTSALTGRTVRP
ncbi:MAG TPA: hypothetical protein VK284_08685 [Streptosporangiaceae bacterium]|nr:hypothetical protein [Streptosporangiaceae bacterium]HLN68548.1 hypothetical protein [Streptosporangiaceae bacterium]